MKLPVSWLKDYVDVELAPAELADRLTFSGTEVESIETIGSDFEGLVVGEIRTVRPHPGADRLSICRVYDGARELDVVCGADNAVAGARAPLAPVGATLPGGHAIRTAKIRGETSEGMLCAEDELGLSDDHGGILLLPPDTAAGTPLAEVLGPPEVVLQMEVTWNRPDCLSIVGMAREVAALLGLPLKPPDLALREDGPPIEDALRVDIADPADCPRYTARMLRNLRLGPSPAWMQRRLKLCGVRPINNIVDVTNYVMLECGHPLHAFDAACIEGGRIEVRRARAGEPFATLDGVERALDGEMLVIADGVKAVALAGVMGGAGSEITDRTQSVLLESATFNPALIHAAATKLGLQTESSHRFERQVDVGGVDWAGRRAAALMHALGGGTVDRGGIDAYPRPAPPRTVTCRTGRVRSLLGIDIGADEIAGILERLQLPLMERDDGRCTVRVPTFRPDLVIEADLIEEVARMHGLDEVPAPLPRARLDPAGDDARFRTARDCRAELVALGLTECAHYSFLAAELLDLFDADGAERRVMLPNPVSSDHAAMRDALLPQMVETLGANAARQTASAGLFEIGRVFRKHADGAIAEQDRLCIGLMGPFGRTAPDGNRPVEAEEIFLWLRGILDGLLAARRLAGVRVESAAHPALEPDWSVSLRRNGDTLGWMGIPRDAIRRHWRLADPIAVAELSLSPFQAVAAPVRLVPVPPYPSVRRDVAVIAGPGIRHADIEAVIRDSAPSELTSIHLFDIFTSKDMGGGWRSLAYALTFRSPERSLTDEDANAYHEAIKLALKQRLNVELRER